MFVGTITDARLAMLPFTLLWWVIGWSLRYVRPTKSQLKGAVFILAYGLGVGALAMGELTAFRSKAGIQGELFKNDSLSFAIFLIGPLLTLFLTFRIAAQRKKQQIGECESDRDNPQIRGTSPTRDGSIRSMRILHILFLAAIVGYLYVAEQFFGHTKDVAISVVEAFSVVAVTGIIFALFYRRKLLGSSIEALRRDGNAATALVQWRAANMLSMVLGMSISLDGLALRAMGSGRGIAWPFFVVSITLMLLWTPRLDDQVIGTNISPPPRA